VVLGVVLQPSPIHARVSTSTARHVAKVRRVIQLIDRHYVESVQVETLIYDAIDGLLGALDRHSEFFPPQTYDTWRARLQGRRLGPGFELEYHGQDLVVRSIIPRSSAENEGLTIGDRLLSVDGESVAGKDIEAVYEQLRGDEGTFLELRFDTGENVPRVLTLERREVRAVAVVGTLLEGGIGHVAIKRFQRGVSDDVLAEYQRLREANGGALVGLVIDVRDNLGGLLKEGIDLADLFLPKNALIITLEGHHGKVLRTHEATREMLIDTPLVVLINERSASASELFAAALRDHRRAVLVGHMTYGKGSVQSTYPLRDGSGLKITTSRYFSPSHERIDEVGIAPDIRVMHASVDADSDVELERARDLLQIHRRLHMASSPLDKVPEHKPASQSQTTQPPIETAD